MELHSMDSAIFKYWLKDTLNFFLFFFFFFLKSLGEKRLVKSVKLLPLRIKSINPIQKYPQITESYACILKIFVTIVDLLINFFDLFWNMFNSKTIKVFGFIIQ